jgi:two-component system NtrC family sensor kinase
MSAARFTRRFSLETKVMAAVLAVLVILPAVTLWSVNRQMYAQMERDAELALSSARQSFLQGVRIHAKELNTRFLPGLADYRFLQILRLNDAATLKDYLLREQLQVYADDTELAAFFGPNGELFTVARTGAGAPVDAFASAVSAQVRTALQGRESTSIVTTGGLAYHTVAVPVRLPERGANPIGTLVFGVRISDEALRGIQGPSTEILLLADNQVAASTLKDATQADAVLRQLADHVARGDNGLVRLAGQRFQPAVGDLADLGAGRVRYVVLSSIEQRLGALEEARTVLLGLSAVGILVGGAVVWFFVRRITHPLVELRDHAEAVGRGDFSRKIESFSNDECGELANAFNRMTVSLQSSRAELERAMQQVKTTQGQLIQSEKLSAVGQFVAGVAHELNNPLTAVVGFAELLQASATDEKMRGHLDRLAKSAHRCHKIVHNLLSFARQHPPERRAVDLRVIAEEVLDIMAYEFRTSDITIVRDYAPDLPATMADPHQLQQVFVNILSNARQAIEPVRREGRITVRTRRQGELVVIEFEDNGPGIRADHLARIFDPFFTTKPVGKGTGLGLSLCYGIVQEHGGRIVARSEIGHGAVFAIELPVAQTRAAPAVITPASASPFPKAAAGSSGKTVLVIDDEQWILDLAGELLRAEGHAVETAQGGSQALEVLGRRKFDVIVSDWKMPGLNGVRLYEHLCATDAAAAKRVLFMTGDVVSDTFQDFLREHGLTCLSKPFATREFRAAVAKVFGNAA